MSDRRKVSLIPGDGIGPEVMAATVKALEALGAGLEFEHCDAGSEVISKYGTNLPRETLDSVLRNGVALKGPTGTQIGAGLPSANVALRKGLDLYAALRPVRSVPNVKTRYENIDLVVVRENTEGLYSGFEGTIPIAGDPKGMAQSVAYTTRFGCERIARFAFEYAVSHGR